MKENITKQKIKTFRKILIKYFTNSSVQYSSKLKVKDCKSYTPNSKAPFSAKNSYFSQIQISNSCNHSTNSLQISDHSSVFCIIFI